MLSQGFCKKAHLVKLVAWTEWPCGQRASFWLKALSGQSSSIVSQLYGPSGPPVEPREWYKRGDKVYKKVVGK